jgi:sulfonate transport system substrate-binding protein
MDRLKFPYRSPTHLPLLHVIAESGAWERYGLEVDYDEKISSEAAHEAVARGDVEFVGGNHVSTYGRRARGDDWIYLGQTVNRVPGWKLAVRSDSEIVGVADLRKKKVVTNGDHPSLNDWLYLKQHGLDVDRDEVDLVNLSRLPPTEHRQSNGERALPWMVVRDGHADAAFVWPPTTVWARRAGLRLIDVDPMPMIFFTTISTGQKFAERHPELVERFLKGMIEGIDFFKRRSEKAVEIIERRYANEGVLDAESARETYDALADALQTNLYPSPTAIANVYEEGIRKDPDARRMQPMDLWDIHFLRRLQDTGFFRDLGAR